MNKQKPLNILFCHYGIKHGGGFSRSYMLAKELGTLGHNVTFLTSQKKKLIFPFQREKVDNLTLISFPDVVPSVVLEKGFGILSPILKTFYILFKHYDILHSDSGHRPNSGLPCLIHRFFHKTCYISEWWDFFGKGGQFNERPLLSKCTLGTWDVLTEIRSKKHCDGIIALSGFTLDRAIKANINKSRLAIIHGGSDFIKIKYHPNNYGLKLKYGISADTIVFGFIGMTKHEFNDIIPFIKAVNILKNEFSICWFTTGMQLSEDVKIEFNIDRGLLEFGWLSYDDYCEVIGLADVFLLLSRENKINRARWPNKVGDYLAAGRLILSNSIGEVETLMNKYPNSFISTKWIEEDIKDKIIKISEMRPHLLEMGARNRKIAENDMSWHSKSLELENFYYNMLRKKLLNSN